MRNKLRKIASMIVVAFLFTVFAMILLINRLVNVTLYNYGLQFRVDWGYPYVIYLYVGMGLLLVSIVLVSLGFVNVYYPAGQDEEQEVNSLWERREERVSASEVFPLPQAREKKTKIQPQSSDSMPIVKQLLVVQCRYCGIENEPDAVFCEKCGESMVTESEPFAEITDLFCGACGTKNRVSAVYCKKCGQLLNQ